MKKSFDYDFDFANERTINLKRENKPKTSLATLRQNEFGLNEYSTELTFGLPFRRKVSLQKSAA